jgi:hypothetical protein
LPHRDPVATEILVTARRRPPRKPGPTEPENGDDGTAVVLEQLRDQRVFLEERLRDQRVFLEERLRDQRVFLEEHLHGQKVFLEQMRSQVQVVYERALDTLTKRESLELAARADARVDLLADVFRVTRKEVAARFDGVDKRFDGVDKRFDGVDKRFDDVEQELRAVRQDVARQGQGLELKALEQRMTVVERHLGL